MGAENFRLRDLGLRVYGPSLLYAVGLGAITPVIALSARALGASVATAALVVTLIGVGSLITNVPAALLTARFGERNSMIAAAGVAALGMVLALLADDVVVLSAAILLVGMAGAVFNLARQSYLAEAVPAYFRARAMSTLGGTIRIGAFAGPFLGAAVMSFVGLEGAYWFGLAAMLAAAGVGFLVPELPVPIAPGPAGAGPPMRSTPPDGQAADPLTADASGTGRTTMRAIGARYWRVFATVGTGVVILSAIRASRQVVIPLWADQLGLDASTAAVVYGISGALDVLVFYPAGRLADRKGHVWAGVPCVFFLSVSLALLPFAHDVATLTAVGALMGLSNGMGTGIVMTLGAEYAPPDARPQFLGLWRLFADTGMMAGPIVLSAVASAVSLAAGMWVLAGAGLVGTGVFAWYLPLYQRARPGRTR
ncbi:MFS transporter [Zhihengliuella sp.]|uniref:MFS transporter n=1 Tax=Zhihengliuella sp. TaxID=1954483 RepID=UPI0028126A18|nr:MFS transporter [Zhihengliuella sp.]